MWGDKIKLRAQMSVQDTLYSLRVVELIRGDEDGSQHIFFNKSKRLRQTLNNRIALLISHKSCETDLIFHIIDIETFENIVNLHSIRNNMNFTKSYDSWKVIVMKFLISSTWKRASCTTVVVRFVMTLRMEDLVIREKEVSGKRVRRGGGRGNVGVGVPVPNSERASGTY